MRGLMWSSRGMESRALTQLYVFYFLKGAFTQNPDNSYKTVSDAEAFARTAVLALIPEGDPLKPWLDPIRLLRGVHVTGAARTDGKPPSNLTLYPPRYGSGHALKNQSTP